jgi:hypothetical protein
MSHDFLLNPKSYDSRGIKDLNTTSGRKKILMNGKKILLKLGDRLLFYRTIDVYLFLRKISAKCQSGN